MNSFTLTAVGNLTRNPELVAKGDVTYTRFCLVGNDYAGKDEEGAPREVTTTLWFVAFGPQGESLVHKARKGDQLIVEARVRANRWTDKHGEKQYDHDFVVQGFRFGAPGKLKREERERQREEALQRGDERGSGPVDGNSIPDGKPGADGASGSEAKGGDKTTIEIESSADVASRVNNGFNGGGGANGSKPTAQRGGRRTTAAPP